MRWPCPCSSALAPSDNTRGRAWKDDASNLKVIKKTPRCGWQVSEFVGHTIPCKVLHGMDQHTHRNRSCSPSTSVPFSEAHHFQDWKSRLLLTPLVGLRPDPARLESIVVSVGAISPRSGYHRDHLPSSTPTMSLSQRVQDHRSPSSIWAKGREARKGPGKTAVASPDPSGTAALGEGR